MNHFNEIRSFRAERAADILYEEMLTPSFIHCLYSAQAGIGKQKGIEYKTDIKNAILCWLEREEKENDWFANFQLRKNLFFQYLEELRSINEGPTNDMTDMESFCSVYAGPCTTWIDIKDGDTVIGFLVMGYGKNCHPDADFYIEESFILPAYRKKGFMRNTVFEFMKTHKGIYCLYVLEENKKAKQFWQHVFAEVNYQPCILKDYATANLIQLGYKPK